MQPQLRNPTVWIELQGMERSSQTWTGLELAVEDIIMTEIIGYLVLMLIRLSPASIDGISLLIVCFIIATATIALPPGGSLYVI